MATKQIVGSIAAGENLGDTRTKIVGNHHAAFD